MYFFTADEHYFHKNIIKYCNRPFKDLDEMNEEQIKRHNLIVGNNDTTIHIGDFLFGKKSRANQIIPELNGKHIFIQGSHDKWLQGTNTSQIFSMKLGTTLIVCCHYAMLVWPKSHFNSWLLFGHSHNCLEGFGKSFDVGVDGNNFYPYSEEEIRSIMEGKPDNFNLVKRAYY